MSSKRDLRKHIGTIVERERLQAKCTMNFLYFLKVLLTSLNANKNDTVKVDKIIKLIKPEIAKLERNIKEQESRLLELSSEFK